MVSRVRNRSSGSTAATRYRFGEVMSLCLLPLPIVVPSIDRPHRFVAETVGSPGGNGAGLVHNREVLVEEVPCLDDLGRRRELARVEAGGVEGQVEAAQREALG